MNNITFNNPILTGFYPDPSICRAGEDSFSLGWSLKKCILC